MLCSCKPVRREAWVVFTCFGAVEGRLCCCYLLSVCWSLCMQWLWILWTLHTRAVTFSKKSCSNKLWLWLHINPAILSVMAFFFTSCWQRACGSWVCRVVGSQRRLYTHLLTVSPQICCRWRVRQLLWPKYFHTLLLRCFGVVIVRSGRLWSLVSSIFVANKIILLAELIGQGSIGQADGEVLEHPRRTANGELLQTVCCFYLLRTFWIRIGHYIWIRTFPPTFERIFEFRIKIDSRTSYCCSDFLKSTEIFN